MRKLFVFSSRLALSVFETLLSRVLKQFLSSSAYHLANRYSRISFFRGRARRSRSIRTISVCLKANGTFLERIEARTSVQAPRDNRNKGKSSFFFFCLLLFSPSQWNFLLVGEDRFFFLPRGFNDEKSSRRRGDDTGRKYGRVTGEENSCINRTVNEVALRSMGNAWVVMYEIARVCPRCTPRCTMQMYRDRRTSSLWQNERASCRCRWIANYLWISRFREIIPLCVNGTRRTIFLAI